MPKKFLDRILENFGTVFLAAFFIVIFLTPRGYEITGETWKAWKSARILLETGRHSAFSMGPLYYTYLNLFKIFAFPTSIHLEFIITHLFMIIGLYRLLKTRLSLGWVWLIIAAWYPYLAMLESTKYVAGVGFLAWHFSLEENHQAKRGFLPPLLILGILCNQGYLFFLVGHALGYGIELLSKRKKPTINFDKLFFLKCLLALFITWVMLGQTKRADNNPFMMDSKYYPVPVENHLNAAFFQMGNFQYISQNYPQELWMEKDWFLTNQEVFAGAQSIREAISFKPDVVWGNIKLNLKAGKDLPTYFLIGDAARNIPTKTIFIFKIFAYFFFTIAALIFLLNFIKKEIYTIPLSLILGSSSLIAAMILTWFNTRYMLQLFPVFLYLFLQFVSFFRTKTAALNLFIESNGKLFLMGSGGLALAGLVIHPWYFIQFGFLFFILLYWYKKQHVLKHLSFILILSIVFFSAPWPFGIRDHFKKIISFQYFLQNPEGMSFNVSYESIFKNLRWEKTVLSNDAVWLQAFAPFPMDQVKHSFMLSPLGNEEDLNNLQNIDEFLISQSWSTPGYSVATQEQLRYQKIIKPFLELQQHLGVIHCFEISNYGKICRKY